MDLTLSDEQQLLGETARAWVARSCPIERVRELESTGTYDPGLFTEIAGLGWAGLPIPESHGGAGAGMLELALVAEALGEGAVPTPLLSSVTLGALPLLWAGGTMAGRLVPALAGGAQIATLALVESGMHDEWGPVAMPGSPRLHGTKILVPWAEAADLFVVATAGGLRVVERTAPGVRVTPHDTLGGDPLAAVEFDSAPAEPIGVGDGATLLYRVLDHVTVVQLAYAVGVAKTMLDLAVAHAGDRHQFGRPIGSFQAVAHRCADMRVDVDACRFLAYRAAWALDRRGEHEVEVAAALAYSKDAIRRIARHSHQVHGAIGFSTEHALHLFSQRAKAFELGGGSAAHHRERLAAAMGLRANS
ncbi:MAG: acyl-CoA dehydrogenase family protein [Solirubrobacterales bacterium]